VGGLARDGLAEEEGELSPEATATDPEGMLREHGIALAEGDRIEISPAAAAWFASAARGLRRGYTLVIDYGYPAPELYAAHRLAGTVRAHRGHTISDAPFAHVGEQDLTAHVDFTALRRAGEDEGLVFAGQTTQGAFLASLEMGDLLVALGRDPATTLPEYLAAQAATLRLIDPGGMGRFGVLIMARRAPISPPLRGFTILPLSF
jgi:SAM-dependent MidA family methyltransferase